MTWVFLLIVANGQIVSSRPAITRIAALAIVVNMVVARLTIGLPNGLFMNWFANQKGEGIEFYLLVIVIGVTLILQGSGMWSVDRNLARQS
jgi:putative oxidoreductase